MPSCLRPAVELRLRKIRGCLAQDLVGLLELAVLAFKRLQAFAFVGGETGALASVTFGLADPVGERLRRAADLGRRSKRRPPTARGSRRRCSKTKRTARSRTSGEYFGKVLF